MLEQGDSIAGTQVEEELGVDISAHRSVPTAIYSFLRASKPIPSIEVCFLALRLIYIINSHSDYY